MSLAADGAVAHGARVEARHDGARALDGIERQRRAPCRIEVEQVAQAHDASRFVQARAVRLERRGVVETHRALQQKDGLGVDEVVLAVQRAPLGEAERG